MHNLCVAHRGSSYSAPENTLAAFRQAMEFPFVKWIELDVQLSRDSVPVVIHDFSLERTTNGTGLVRDKSWDELRRLDAGSWKSLRYRGEPIPSLVEVLDLCKGKVHLNIELKTTGDMYPGLEREVLRLIISRGMEQDVVLTSFDQQALRRVKELMPGIGTGLITDIRPADLSTRLSSLGCSFLSMAYPKIDAKLMTEMTKQGVAVMAWTADQAGAIRRLVSLHPDLMICTNRPETWDQAVNGTSLLGNTLLTIKRWLIR
ncbi:glycerophosphodiester phosphodiesterase family protein [Paenibacillus sp. P96]|uniref:Glycerophosphodiester phosphodiesterase family protein n=1 Tax=Paenibacillus zeirhizosphaerae TaxID=2987519 RepID=A0ABT9FSR8_9BACL|nr:glycerophosphodiester phosphodiesterase family protein [Paenibacillus sp. P96]MDP4097756.1 glycerophosphodiester phosphodiesterase family protein [Paenibacillus sp. P96]